jgi:peptidoglycan/LPS O-acetylase OafA/YrhL
MLRALAALMVLYSHTLGQLKMFAMDWQQRIPTSSSFATYGVDLFFVISGFVIYHTAGRLMGRSQAISFLWHRFRRINPGYYAATVLTLASWLPSFLRHQRPLPSCRELLSSAILLPFPGNTGNILFQAWSLAYEWYFYLLFFFLIAWRTQKKERVISFLLFAMILLGLLLPDHLLGNFDFYTDPITFEFLLGVGIGFCYHRYTPGKWTILALLLPGILVSGVVLFTGYGDILGDPEYRTLNFKIIHSLTWGGAAALIVSGCAFLEKYNPKPFQRHKWVHLLGDASYSIYLVHMIFLSAMAALYLRVGFFLSRGLATPIHMMIALAGSLLFYRWVELPLLTMLKKKTNAPLPTPSRPIGT